MAAATELGQTQIQVGDFLDGGRRPSVPCATGTPRYYATGAGLDGASASLHESDDFARNTRRWEGSRQGWRSWTAPQRLETDVVCFSSNSHTPVVGLLPRAIAPFPSLVQLGRHPLEWTWERLTRLGEGYPTPPLHSADIRSVRLDLREAELSATV